MTDIVNGSIIGKPADRIDGRLKVTGAATYAYETAVPRAAAYGYIVSAPIAKGRIVRIDTRAADSMPGVLLVMTHLNAPAQGKRVPLPNQFARAKPVLASDRIRFYGETVAVVVATTLEQARSAAGAVEVEYEAAADGRYDFRRDLPLAYAPEVINVGLETDTSEGDFDRAYAAAEVTIDQTIYTPYQFANPMEPHACLAYWDEDEEGERLTVHMSTQTVMNIRAGLAATLMIDPQRLRIVSPFTGGGFGSKLILQDETALAALAARKLGMPVRLAMTRQQMFHLLGHRPAMRQRLRLAAAQDGTLAAMSHDVTMQSRPEDEFAEQTATVSRGLYAAPNRSTTHRLVPSDLQVGEPVRGPGEGPGMMATEGAMDELAYRLGMDPVQLRIRNEPAIDPERKVPFSGRRLVDCLEEGARRFGWEQRPATPGTLREGRLLVGYGVASAMRMNFQGATAASVELTLDAMAVVRTDMTDIGTGTYTILAQVAADCLGLPLARVRVELGDSAHPQSSGSGGSWGAANTSVAVARACAALRRQLGQAAVSQAQGPLAGLDASAAQFSGDAVHIGARAQSLAEVAALAAPHQRKAEGRVADQTEVPEYSNYSQHTYGAQFAEVSVDIDTGEVRVRRMLGVFCAGRIINPKTARSQLIGGMIWGVSQALFEEGVVDPRHGLFINHDMAEYHVAVNADIASIDAVCLDDRDYAANEMGMKGVGELGICGAGAAVANAVYNATGVRVSDFPITLDKLLDGLARLDGE